MIIEPGFEALVETLIGDMEPNMATIMGLEFSKLTKEECIATMPVHSATVQPFRMLHGGASVAMAETLASVGAWLHVPKDKTAVGLEINANHHRPVKEGGQVTGVAKPIQIGRTIQVWDIQIMDEKERLVCTSRCTIAVINRPN
jgi:1,4-dihydroxy-2-naphthoyl-CoA hydrolase